MRSRMQQWVRDRTLVPEQYADDFVWDMTTAEWPETGEYHGVEGVREFFRQWLGAFDDWSYELQDVIEAEDGRVVVLGVQRGVNRGAAVPVEMHLAQVWTLDGEGRALRMEMYT